MLLQAKRTDCNHIFLHFVPCVIIEPNRVGLSEICLASCSIIRELTVYESEMYRQTALAADFRYGELKVHYTFNSCHRIF